MIKHNNIFYYIVATTSIFFYYRNEDTFEMVVGFQTDLMDNTTELFT